MFRISKIWFFGPEIIINFIIKKGGLVTEIAFKNKCSEDYPTKIKDFLSGQILLHSSSEKNNNNENFDYEMG